LQCHANGFAVKYWIKIDDSMDVFAEHGLAGIIGLLANGFLGSDAVVGLDGVNTGLGYGGGLIGNWKQLYIQIAYIVAASAYAFVMSAIIAYGINYIPGLHLRASEEAELLGMDDDQLGEFAYDYVEVRRDYLAWTPSRTDQMGGEHSIPQKERHGIGEHSTMIEGKSSGSDSAGEEHTGIGGDRHAVAAEDKKHPEKVE
jgi:ammonium transporter, Amt family